MEFFQSLKIFSCFFIWYFLFHFSSLFVPSASYILPDKYFINCGSSSTLTLHDRQFTGDEKPRNLVLISDGTKPVQNGSVSTTELHGSARIFTKSSVYELNIDQDQAGIYVVRFHFFHFPSLGNPSDARFSVWASGFWLLSNFTDSSSVKEFLLKLPQGKFKIYFVPNHNSFAFVNAIEVFLAPTEFIHDSGPHITRQGNGKDYNGLLTRPLHVIHRINVGGLNIMPDADTLWRNWIPDDDYLLIKNTAKNSEVYGGKPKYQNHIATEFDAPDFVYKTAKEMNIGNNVNGTLNISWRFDVQNGATYFVRVHFCDIVTQTTNEFQRFNLYIYSNFVKEMWPYGIFSQLAVPFYQDFVVDSDDSGFMNISVGPNLGSRHQTAFLNGVEIMALIQESGPAPRVSGSPRLNIIVVGSVVGGVVLVLIIFAVLFFVLKKRKWKPVEAFDWPLAPSHWGTSYSRTTATTTGGSTHADFELGLKIPFSEILYSTKRFDRKLMIGEGGFGKVYKGMLYNGTKVAIKRSEPGHGQGLAEFQTEIIVFSKIRHQHLVSLIGYCNEGNEMILVYEFMEKGTLRDHLYILPGEKTRESTSRSVLSWDERLHICIGAATGLHYLHTGSTGTIIHRDVKSTNILLDEHYVAKVADFGLSRLGQLDQSYVSTEVKGSFGYLDPEYFRCLQLTQKSDVYSFGVVLLEVLCARQVIDISLPPEQVTLADWGISWQRKGQLEKIVDPFLVGKINPNSLRKFGATFERCLQENGADRPNMVDVLWDLEYCLKLQHTAMPGEAYEDSNTGVSWGLSMPVVERLPSSSFAIAEDEAVDDSYSFSDGSQSQMNASEVFTQLKTNEAR